MTAAISVRKLRKSFGDRQVVSGIDFDVEAGECFGFLGHNGAGKTTTIEILEGYLERDAGEVSVLGTDPAHATSDWRARLGFVLQSVELLPTLSIAETVQMFADLYPNPRPVGETIELVGLAGLGTSRVGGLSGGEQRRVDVALGLIGNPELLFLDEPTTGFDPSARRDAWQMIDNLKTLGVTIVLTTHYMEEAEALADRLLILSAGEVAVEGTYDQLVARHGSATEITFVVPGAVTVESMRSATDVDVRANGSGLAVVASEQPQRDIYRLTKWAEEHDVVLDQLAMRRESLEDVFLALDHQHEESFDTGPAPGTAPNEVTALEEAT